MDDVEAYIRQGWYIVATVNPNKFESIEGGYNSHFVLVHGFTEQRLIFHDPGLPPIPNREVGKKVFFDALACPYRELICFKSPNRAKTFVPQSIT
jgi:hypothetical protein